MSILDLIKKFDSHPKWQVQPTTSLPSSETKWARPHLPFPKDMLSFYGQCSGVESLLESDDELEISIFTPNKMSWAVDILFGKFEDKRGLMSHQDKHTWNWYLLGKYEFPEDYIVIDLAPERYGYCYLGNFYNFGFPRDTIVVGHSFTELLEELYQAIETGEQWLDQIKQYKRLEDIMG